MLNSAWVDGQRRTIVAQRAVLSGTTESFGPQPVPVFMTYFTVAPWGNGLQFRADPYGFDDRAMRQMFGAGKKL